MRRSKNSRRRKINTPLRNLDISVPNLRHSPNLTRHILDRPETRDSLPKERHSDFKRLKLLTHKRLSLHLYHRPFKLYGSHQTNHSPGVGRRPKPKTPRRRLEISGCLSNLPPSTDSRRLQLNTSHPSLISSLLDSRPSPSDPRLLKTSTSLLSLRHSSTNSRRLNCPSVLGWLKTSASLLNLRHSSSDARRLELVGSNKSLEVGSPGVEPLKSSGSLQSRGSRQKSRHSPSIVRPHKLNIPRRSLKPSSSLQNEPHLSGLLHWRLNLNVARENPELHPVPKYPRSLQNEPYISGLLHKRLSFNVAGENPELHTFPKYLKRHSSRQDSRNPSGHVGLNIPARSLKCAVQNEPHSSSLGHSSNFDKSDLKSHNDRKTIRRKFFDNHFKTSRSI